MIDIYIINDKPVDLSIPCLLSGKYLGSSWSLHWSARGSCYECLSPLPSPVSRVCRLVPGQQESKHGDQEGDKKS